MRERYIETTWAVKTYDVHGNAHASEQILRIPVTTHNVGTPYEFESASPTDAQLQTVLNCPCVRIDKDGDDLVIFVNRSHDSCLLGELYCVSHESLLNPIRSRTVPLNSVLLLASIDHASAT